MMKKLLISSILVVTVLFLLPEANAQKIGARAGINVSRLSISGNSDDIEAAKDGVAFLTSASYGLYLNYKIIPLLSLQIEGNYDPRGNKFDSQYAEFLYQNQVQKSSVNISFDGEMSDKLNYLTFPVMLKANLALFHVEAGPYVSLLLNAKRMQKGTFTVNGSTITKNEENDTKGYYKSTDAGIAAGIGMTFNLGPLQIMAGARYMMGMTNIYKDPVDGASAKHQVLNIYAGAAIGL